MSINHTFIEISDLVDVLTSMQRSEPMDSQQVTQMVPVPTSEHVAQIVGKCGSKIKFLRTETGTCIKTPYRGDDPVFVVTGHPDNVRMAVAAIEKASNHFTRLMESRSNTCAVGEVTVLVEVPQQYVGVVVGRNGSVIIKIKEQTNTRINTPKGDAANPSFEVTGTRVNVEAAKEAILDKVYQAFQLRSSSKFDPNLSQSKFLTKIIQMESPSSQSLPSLPSPPSPTHSVDIHAFKWMSPMSTLPMTPSMFEPIFNYDYVNADKNEMFC